MAAVPSPKQLMSAFAGESLKLEQVRSPALTEALSYWTVKRGDRVFPARSDLAPEEMKAFLSHVMLVDVSYEPLNYVYRVFGTGVATAHRKDFTGQSVKNLQPKEFAELIWSQYTEVVSQRQPLAHKIKFNSPTDKVAYARLVLPLSTDGAAIDKLLAVSSEDNAFWRVVDANYGRT